MREKYLIKALIKPLPHNAWDVPHSIISSSLRPLTQVAEYLIEEFVLKSSYLKKVIV